MLKDRKQFALAALGVLLGIDVLLLLIHASDVWVYKVLAFGGLSLFPGYLLVKATKLKAPGLEKVLYSFGLSILVLMLSGLLANQLLQAFDITRPLNVWSIAMCWNACVLLAIGLAFMARSTVSVSAYPWRQVSKVQLAMVAASLAIPLIATAGAFRLNNGGDALFANGALCYMGLFFAAILIWRKRLSDSTLAWSIFSIGLGVLLMTSMRSWDITGHDMAREFRVFTLTHVYGFWNIDAYRDPYNACLSISILPESYVQLLNISGLAVFKLILQVIFAACPAVIFYILRRHVSKLAALTGIGLFLSYPTFVNDSAMLTRQGVAYLFFALAVLALSTVHRNKAHKLLFLLCSVGIILSHYSTTYMFVALFALALICKVVIGRMQGQKHWWPKEKFGIVSPIIFLTVSLTAFMWYSQVTATSGGLVTTLTTSAKNLPHMFSDDNKSSDTSAALVLAAHKSQIQLYQSYLLGSIQRNAIVDAPQYQAEISADNIPITPLGRNITKIGLEPTVTAVVRQWFGKILQVTAAVGVGFAVVMLLRKNNKALPVDLVCLSVAGMAVLILMVVMPNLSQNYGVLRSFQQSLIFVTVPLTVFLVASAGRLWPWLRRSLAMVGTVGLFLLFTGYFAQLLGGTGAPLTLNNHGLYYGLYYTSKADLATFEWAKKQAPKKTDVRAASHAKALMHDPKYPFARTGILPTMRPEGSIVILEEAQMLNQKFYVYHEASPLIMSFPTDYYNEHSNQIYSTTTTGIYR